MAKMHFPPKYSAEKTVEYDGPYISHCSQMLSIKDEDKDDDGEGWFRNFILKRLFLANFIYMVSKEI